MYNMMFEVGAYFKKQDGGASSTPLQRAVVCGEGKKMLRARVDGALSAMRLCVDESLTSMPMPPNT